MAKEAKLLSARFTNSEVQMVLMHDGVPLSVASTRADNGSNLSEILSSLRQRLGTSEKDVAFCIPQDKVISLNSLEIEPMDEDTLFMNLPYEFKDYIPESNITEYEYDYIVLHDNADFEGKSTSITIAAIAIRKEILEYYKNLAKNAGLRLIRLLPENECIKDIIEHADRIGEIAYCFVDVGSDISILNVFLNGELVFHREIEMEFDAYSISVEVDMTIKRCMLEYPSADFKKIYLMGRYACDENLRTSLTEQLYDVDVDDVASLLDNTLTKEENCMFAPAIGLGFEGGVE